MSTLDLPQTHERTVLAVLLVVFAGLLVPLCFLGYGAWLNIYMMLSAGKSTWLEHVLETSRPPGYWTYEALMLVASRAGGYVATNLVNLAAGLADIALTYRLARRWGARSPLACAAIVAANPVFIVESTSSQDFNLSLMFLLLGVLALDSRRLAIAGLCCGIACLLRLSAVVPVAGIYLAFLIVERHDRGYALRLVASGAIAAAFFVATCIPSYLVLGPTFYKGGVGPDEMWNAKTWIGRFVYKTAYFIGGPLAAGGALVLAAMALVRSRREGGRVRARGHPVRLERETILIWVSLAGGVALFAKFPIRQSYLIVALPFMALAIDRLSIALGRALPWIVVAASLIQSLVVVNLAKPDIVGRATSGRLAFAIEPGYVLADIRDRRPLIGCDSLDCFNRVMGVQPDKP